MTHDFDQFINKLQSDTTKIIYLAKISLLNFNKFPKNLPQSEIDSYKNSKLEWVKKDEDSWVGSPRDTSKSNTLNEFVYLAHEKNETERKIEETKTKISKLNIESDELEIQNLESLLEILNAPIRTDLSYIFEQTILQQAVMMMFAKFEAYLQELLRFICNIDNRVLLHKNLGAGQVSINTIIFEVDGFDSLLDYIIDKHVIAFGHLSLKERIDYLKGSLKLNLNLNDTLLKNAYNAEQARHVFTHNNGFASSITEDKTKKDFKKDDYLQLNLEYCLALQDGLLSIFQQTIMAASERFNMQEESKL